MFFYLIFFAVSFFITALWTLGGFGGSIIFVPLFILWMKFNNKVAVGTALWLVFFNSVSGTIAYLINKKVYVKAAILFSITAIPGAILGTFINSIINANVFRYVFSLSLTVIGFNMLFFNKQTYMSINHNYHHFNRLLGLVISFIVGFFSGLLGIGGGVIHVPIMVLILEFPVHTAAATSHFVLAITTGIGALMQIFWYNVNWRIVFVALPGILAGAQFGAWISPKIKSKIIVKILALCLLLVSFKLFANI